MAEAQIRINLKATWTFTWTDHLKRTRGTDVFTETEEVKESESEDMGKKKRISMKTNHLLTKLIINSML